MLCRAGVFLGVRLDAAQNENGRDDRLVSPAESSVAVLALTTNDELIVARRAYKLLACK